jgi:hypothetical protein
MYFSIIDLIIFSSWTFAETNTHYIIDAKREYYTLTVRVYIYIYTPVHDYDRRKAPIGIARDPNSEGVR